MSLLIGFYPVREPGKICVGNDLSPASQVEPGLRSEVWQLDPKRHKAKQSVTEAAKQCCLAERVGRASRPCYSGEVASKMRPYLFEGAGLPTIFYTPSRASAYLCVSSRAR